MSHDESTPDTSPETTPGDRRDAVRAKAKQVQQRQSRTRLIQRVSLATVIVAVVAAVAVVITWTVSSNASRPMAQPANVTEDGFEVTDVTGVGSVGETGSNTNILTYETWDDEVVQKGKGLTDAGSPDIEVARDPDDAGQIILRAAAETNFSYALKIEGNDAPPGANSTPTIRYNRGLVTGPREPNCRNEDFDLEIFGTGLQQKQIKGAPVAGA